MRDQLTAGGSAILTLDLAPGRSLERLTTDLSRPRGRDSLANHLRRHAGIEGVKAGLLRECCQPSTLSSAGSLAAAIKALPLKVTATRPLDEAISTAGGVAFEGLDTNLMVERLPGVFVAGVHGVGYGRVYSRTGRGALAGLAGHFRLRSFGQEKQGAFEIESRNEFFELTVIAA